jgi:uncharacterized protein YjiS (DUF1127 family)
MPLIGPDRGRGWRRVKRTFAKWRRDRHLHRELVTRSDRCLEDIGLSHRSTTDVRPSKPFLPP